MKSLITGFTTTRNIRAAARAYRRSTQRTARLDRELAAAVGRSGDRTTRAHLLDARDQIKAMLDTEK